MNDNDDDFKLRDQLAIAAMQALITKYGCWGKYIVENEGDGPFKAPGPRTQRIALVAYRIADEMRKARLKSFK
jgi:hypothetical protein